MSTSAAEAGTCGRGPVSGPPRRADGTVRDRRAADPYPIADARGDEARHIAAHLRPADRVEILASTGSSDVATAILQSLATSCVARCAWAPGEGGPVPAVIWGVAPVSYLTGVGVPWMVATPALDMHWRAFLRRCRPELAAMTRGFRVLRNHVDTRNEIAVKWLAWLGFTIHPAASYGPMGLPFHEFTMDVSGPRTRPPGPPGPPRTARRSASPTRRDA